MKRLFPPLYDRPEKFMPFAALGYWLFAFVLIPLFFPLLGDGLWTDRQFASWLEFAYHTVNALVMASMFKSYLVDSFLNVQLDLGKFFKTVGFALLLMMPLVVWVYAVLLPLMYSVSNFPIPYVVLDAYPINELVVAISASLMVQELPLFGTLCHVLFAPVAVVCLFYAVGFAPMCCRKPWLGYLTVTILLMLPGAFDILWRGQADMTIAIYLMQLPIHLLACWTYQKADTVWAPIATLSVFNLITSLCNIFLM